MTSDKSLESFKRDKILCDQRRAEDHAAKRQIPFAELPLMEILDEGEAMEWWPFRPVLAVTPTPGLGVTDYVAWSQSGGRSGSPPGEFAYVMVMHQPAASTVHNSGYFEILDAGGISIRSTYIPAGQAWSTAGEPAMARGHAVWVHVLRKSDGVATEDWMRVNWIEAVPKHGGSMMWEVACSPERYSRADCLDATERMSPVGR